ncbi:MAG: hypothetical protein AB2A00_04015 [Myxococcota bacterium]
MAITLREREFKQALVSQAAVTTGARVLDLGCATGEVREPH